MLIPSAVRKECARKMLIISYISIVPLTRYLLITSGKKDTSEVNICPHSNSKLIPAQNVLHIIRDIFLLMLDESKVIAIW